MIRLLIKIIFLIPLSGIAQADTSKVMETEYYCARMKGRHIIMMAGPRELDSDIVLENGWIIRTYGSILKADGRVIILKDGECVDSEGRPVRPRLREKRIKEEALNK